MVSAGPGYCFFTMSGDDGRAGRTGTGQAMTMELQQAMVRYEEARIRYRTAVLDSLNGEARGDAIRAAIREIQAATAELKRLQPRPPPPEPASEPVSIPGWSLVRRLLTAS